MRPAAGTTDAATTDAGTALRWTQPLPRFAPLREGGPGRPATLVALALALAALARFGAQQTRVQGIDGAGPAALLLAAVGFGTLALWLLVKAVLRPLSAEVHVDARGVRLRPEGAQRRLDRAMQGLMRLAFLFSWKGGQWAAFAPQIGWREVTEIRHWPRRREYLLRGGPWDIRLRCPPEAEGKLRGLLRTALPPGAPPRGTPAARKTARPGPRDG